jgi:hypothetical protein
MKFYRVSWPTADARAASTPFQTALSTLIKAGI